MDDEKRLGIDLLCGVIDALPCPAALLNGDGQAAYVSSRECPVDLEGVLAEGHAALREIISRCEPFGSRMRLDDGERAAWGLAELYPIHANGKVVGTLLMFRPDESPAKEPLRETRQAHAAEQISRKLEAYGDSTEAKRRAAGELGIGLSTLYRIMANEKKKVSDKRS